MDLSGYRAGFAALILILLAATGPLEAGRQFAAAQGEPVVADELIVRLRTGVGYNSLAGLLPPGATSRPLAGVNAAVVKVANANDRPGLSNTLASSPLVDYVEPNRIRTNTLVTPNDPSYGSEWGLAKIQALQAWGLLPNRYLTSATAGTGRVKVAVLDTGADCTHPDFRNAGGSSTDSLLGGQFSFSLSRALISTTIAGPACPWQDDHYHGTHVAGTVAASTHNGTGVAGAAYAVELVIYKVLSSSGSGSDSTIAAAIMDAADDGVQVISLSLGGAGYSQLLQDAVNYAWQRNALVVAAAGNNGSSALFFPAGANRAVGVAATDSNDARASFSNFGANVDIAAPGVSVYSTMPNSSYANLSGTSMATPHVSAIAGLVATATPGLASEQVALRLQRAADSSIAAGGWDQYYGYGRLNAFRAVGGNLRTATAGSVVGQVTDASGLPLSSATVSVGGQSTVTSSTGLFRIANLGTGVQTLTATRTGSPSRTMTVVAPPGGDVTVPVVMSSTIGEIRGVVVSNGSPVAWATVLAISGGLARSSALTDANGNYWLYVPAGTYDVRGSAVGRSNGTINGQSVAAGGSTVAPNVTLASLGNIAGTVRNGSGTPIAGAEISITGPSTAGAVTSAAGTYSTIGLPSGTYSLTVTASGYPATTIAAVVVNPDSTANGDVVMGGTAPISVSVSPAAVSLTNGQSQQFTATVTGTTTTSVTWSMTPSVGTLSSGGLYTAPATVSSAQTVNIRATSVADPTKFSEAAISLTVSGGGGGGGGTTVRVNAGGAAYTDPLGQGWSADGGFSAGQMRQRTDTVSGTTTPYLYQTYRFHTADFSWQTAVPNGNYRVTLKFADFFIGYTGGRVFGVAINGQQVLSNFDIYAAAGGAAKAVDRSFDIAVTNGQVNVQFQKGIENPLICAIEVVPQGGSSVAVSVSPSTASLTAGQTRQFTATVTGTTNQAVTWSLSPNVGTISSAGLYTAPSSITSQQTVTVRATSQADATKSATATVTLNPTIGVSVTPPSVSLGASQTQQFAASVTGTANQAVTWSISPNVGTISSSGLYTAPLTVSVTQTVTVTATSAADGTKSGTATVSLTAPAAGTSIRVNAGGAAYTDPLGQVWSSDSGFNAGQTRQRSDAVSGTTTPYLYQTYRFHTANFNWQSAIPNGNYRVTLKFADFFITAAGGRLFHVTINGQQVLTNFDIYAAAGMAGKAVDRSFDITVTNGQVNVQFIKGVENPVIGAIEVVPR